MPCSFWPRHVGRSSPAACSAGPRHVTLPWPKMANTPGTSGASTPSIDRALGDQVAHDRLGRRHPDGLHGSVLRAGRRTVSHRPRPPRPQHGVLHADVLDGGGEPRVERPPLGDGGGEVVVLDRDEVLEADPVGPARARTHRARRTGRRRTRSCSRCAARRGRGRPRARSSARGSSAPTRPCRRSRSRAGSPGRSSSGTPRTCRPRRRRSARWRRTSPRWSRVPVGSPGAPRS